MRGGPGLLVIPLIVVLTVLEQLAGGLLVVVAVLALVSFGLAVREHAAALLPSVLCLLLAVFGAVYPSGLLVLGLVGSGVTTIAAMLGLLVAGSGRKTGGRGSSRATSPQATERRG